MRTIYYKVAVSPEEEQFFLIAMELLWFKCKKDYEEIIYENGFEEKKVKEGLKMGQHNRHALLSSRTGNISSGDMAIKSYLFYECLCICMKGKRPICPHCGSGTVYVRKDMSLKCHRCGYDSRRDEE